VPDKVSNVARDGTSGSSDALPEQNSSHDRAVDNPSLNKEASLPKRFFSALSLVIGLAAPARARAQSSEPTEPPVSFGSSGQLVLSVDRLAGAQVNVVRSKADGSDESCSGTNATVFFVGSDTGPSRCSSNGPATIAWGADVFVARGISLGGSANFTSSTNEENQRMAVGSSFLLRNNFSWRRLALAPRVGYAHALGSGWTIWPRAGIDWVEAKGDTEVRFDDTDGMPRTMTSKITWHLVTATVETKFVFSPLSHVALFGGPFVRLPIWMSSKQEQDGANTELRTRAYELGATAGVLLYM
jgi:hypothetical protein